MKKILSVALALVMLLGLIPTVVAEETKTYSVNFYKESKQDDLHQLNNLDISNTQSLINEGETYSTTISLNTDKSEIDSVVVIMGENTPVYPLKTDDGSYIINIPKVTGKICIAVDTSSTEFPIYGRKGKNYYTTNLSHVTSQHCQNSKNDYPEILTTQIKPSGTLIFEDFFTPDEGYGIVDFKVETSNNFNGNRIDITDTDSILGDKTVIKNEDGSYKVTTPGSASIYVTAVAIPLSEIPTYTKPTTEPTSTEPTSTEPTSTEPTSTESTSTEPTSTEITATEPTKPVDFEVNDITLNKTKLTLNKGTFSTLRAVVTTNNATNKGVTFKSSNTKVAKVTSDGDVLAMGKGTCTITATSKSNSKIKDNCKVTVR